MSRLKKIYKGEQGFTLVEMLIVLFIIGALLLIIVPSLSGAGADAQEKACDANKQMLTNMVENYHLEHGSYPNRADLEGTNYIDEVPTCPAGEENDHYTFEGGQVSCPIHGD